LSNIFRKFLYMDILNILQNSLVSRGLGIVTIFIISIFMSNNRLKIEWKNVFFMFISIWIFAYFLLHSYIGINFIGTIASGVDWLYGAGLEGVKFLFGDLTSISGPWGFIFAIRVLPMIIFFSALTSILYYFGIIQWIVHLVGFVVRPLYGTTGPETVCAIGNSVLSQTESPLLIKSYLKYMSESEIFVVMVSGMATISSGLFAVYGALGIPIKHLLVSSILSVPASLFISKLWFPPTKKENIKEKLVKSEDNGSFFEALAAGTSNGLMLSLNVGAMLLVIIALLFCINQFILCIGEFFMPNSSFSLGSIFSIIMWPASWAMGVSGIEVSQIASLLGSKIAINEMVAYISLAKMNLSHQALIYATYALCGFSNFSCIGIQISCIGNIEESIKPILSKLGLKAVFAAAMSNLLVTYIIGFFI
jgi:CNT family concentrative nucleoside transporter